MHKSAKIISFLLVLLLCVSMVASCGKKVDLRKTVIISTQNHEINGVLFHIFFRDSLKEFLTYYADWLDYYAIDPEKPLREQEVQEGTSWYDYFAEICYESLSTTLIYNEYAAKIGVSLTDAEKNAIRARADKTDLSAYGDFVTHDDLYEAYLIEALAWKCDEALVESFTPDAATLDGYRNLPNDDYLSVDLVGFCLTYDNADEENYQKCLSLMEGLRPCSTVEAFQQKATEILTELYPEADADTVGKQIEDTVMNGVVRSGSSVDDWAFGDEANVGDTLLVDEPDESKITMYLLTKKPYLNTEKTATIRAIFQSGDKAHETLENVKKAFLSGNTSEEAFALLAATESEDRETCYTGGLYRYVQHGNLEAPLAEWVFDSSRKKGDTAVIDAENGSYLLYYVSDDIETWLINIIDELIEERLEGVSDTFASYTVNFDTKALNNIPE